MDGKFSLAVDVGCGSGQSADGLASNFNRVLGVDISESQIEQAVATNTCSNVEYRSASNTSTHNRC